MTMAIPVSVVANGARTPLGLRARPSAVALRAGISAVVEHPFMLDRSGNPVMGALDSQLDPRLMGAERLLALAEGALVEACASLGPKTTRRSRLPLYLSLPEVRPGFSARDVEAVRTGLLRMKELPFQFTEVNTLAGGHAAGLSALAMAAEQFEHGAFDLCVVGGVDSYFQPETLGWLDANRQLAGPISRSGFVPGEGAAFCLLKAGDVYQREGHEALPRLRAVAMGQESNRIKTNTICIGEGLAATVQDVMRGVSAPHKGIDAIICDINGERYRGEEWGFACLRLSQYLADPTSYVSPADGWGDMGAASGPLFVMLACQATPAGNNGSRTLLWASSEAGLRAAAVLETAGIHQEATSTWG